MNEGLLKASEKVRQASLDDYQSGVQTSGMCAAVSELITAIEEEKISTKKSDNELIAEFMGWKRKEHPLGGNYWWQSVDSKEMSKGTWTPCCMVGNEAFNYSWDWLMPVVEKIEGTGCGFEIYNKSSNINGKPPASHGETKIKAVYETAVNFIKWYNKNRKVSYD